MRGALSDQWHISGNDTSRLGRHQSREGGIGQSEEVELVTTDELAVLSPLESLEEDFLMSAINHTREN